MVGGTLSAPLLSMLIIPAAYLLLGRRNLAQPQQVAGRAPDAITPVAEAQANSETESASLRLAFPAMARSSALAVLQAVSRPKLAVGEPKDLAFGLRN